MKRNHDSESGVAKENATMHVFRCPVCGGHQLSVVFEIYGMRDIVGVTADDNILFGGIDLQGEDYGMCKCPDCEWEGEFYRDHDGKRSFHTHLVVTRLLRFTCAKCGGHELRRLRQGHVTSYLVSAVYHDPTDGTEKVAVDMLEREDDGGQFGYGCGSCHRAITDEADAPITKEGDLIAWLKTHQ